MNVNSPSFNNLVSVMEQVRDIRSKGGEPFIIRSGNECYVTTHKHLHQGKRLDVGEFAKLIAQSVSKPNFDSRMGGRDAQERGFDDLRKLTVLDQGLSEMIPAEQPPVQGRIHGFIRKHFGPDEQGILKELVRASAQVRDRIQETRTSLEQLEAGGRALRKAGYDGGEFPKGELLDGGNALKINEGYVDPDRFVGNEAIIDPAPIRNEPTEEEMRNFRNELNNIKDKIEHARSSKNKYVISDTLRSPIVSELLLQELQKDQGLKVIDRGGERMGGERQFLIEILNVPQ